MRPVVATLSIAGLMAGVALLSACTTAPTTTVAPAKSPDVGFVSLRARLHRGLDSDDKTDAVNALLALAERFPARINEVSYDDVRRAVDAAPGLRSSLRSPL